MKAAWFLSCWLIATTASAELITGHRSSSGFGWDYRYDISMVGDTIHVRNELYLFPVEVTQSEIDDIWPVWEQAIESVWSTADIIFDITRGAAYDYFVYVIPGRTRNMSIWGLSPGENSGLMAAHEYGHMIGLYDEYRGGATDPAGALIDASSIMGSVNHDVQTHPRHYDQFYAWADEQRVPEPGTLALVLLGLMLVRRIRPLCKRDRR